MEYYYLSREFEPKVVGVTHGAGQFSIDQKFGDAHPWYIDIFYEKPRQTKDWWKYWAKMPTYGSSLKELTMDKKSKHTDIIDTAGFKRGFIVSDRLRNILENAHLPNHKFFETTFNHNGNVVDGYWWFVYDMETGEHTVDFAKSEFTVDKHEARYGKRFTIKSYEDYINIFYETGEALGARKLVFNKNFDKELDIFGTQFLSSRRAYISDRFLKEWQEAKITGFRVRTLEDVKMKAQLFNDSYCDLVFD